MNLSLHDFVGRYIWAVCPPFAPKETPHVLLKLRLHGVETCGVWVESEDAVNPNLRNVPVFLSFLNISVISPFAEPQGGGTPFLI